MLFLLASRAGFIDFEDFFDFLDDRGIDFFLSFFFGLADDFFADDTDFRVFFGEPGRDVDVCAIEL